MAAYRLLRNRLGDVPMFDDFAVGIEAENIDHRLAAVIRRALAVHMDDHQIALGDDALDGGARLRMFLEIRRKRIDERLAAVGNTRIVLDIGFCDVFCDRLIQLVLVEGELVEGGDIFLVARERVGGKSQRGAGGKGGSEKDFFMELLLD